MKGALLQSAPYSGGRKVLHGPWWCHGSKRARLHVCPAFRVTPYQPKQDEPLKDIAAEKGMTMHELKSLNHELNLSELDPGQSILVPQEKLSPENRQILENMIARSYRTYAVREGENIESIISSRNIEREEIEALNPDTDLDNLAYREVIKLPAHKFSQHEQYEMHGTLGSRVLRPGTWLANGLVAGTLCIALYCFWLYQQSKRAREAADMARKINASRKKYEVPEGLPQPSYMASLDEPLDEPEESSET